MSENKVICSAVQWSLKDTGYTEPEYNCFLIPHQFGKFNQQLLQKQGNFVVNNDLM